MAHLATFAGCIYVARVDEDGNIIDQSGNPSDEWYFLGEVAPLSIQLPDDEPTTIKGRTCATYGKIIASKAQPGNATGTLTLHEYTAQNVARALRGMVTVTPASSTDITKTVTLRNIDRYVDIGETHISPGYTVKIGDETLVEGEDYDINPALGLIAAKSANAKDKTITVTGQSAPPSRTHIVIGATAAQKYAIKGLLINEFTGGKVGVYLRKVLFSSNAEIVLVSEEETEHEAIQMALTLEIPNGQTDYGTIDGLPLFG